MEWLPSQQEIGIMSAGTNSGSAGRNRLLYLCFVQENFCALRLQVGRVPRVWLNSRECPMPSDVLSTGELDSNEMTRSGIDNILRQAPKQGGFRSDLETNGIGAFFHPEFPVIVYAEKRDGEVELFIHREPGPTVPGDEEEE
jgi:hypothetical protein